MREAIKKGLLAFFAASLVVPAVLLPLPRNADAFIGCLIGALTNKAISTVQDGAKDLANTFTAVSVHDSTVTSAARQTRDEAKTLKIKECTLDGMVTLLGQTMLQTFTKSIVDWINRGFDGEPAFITNPGGFATEVADRVVGAQIKAVAPFLCQPFRLQLQLALGLQYSSNRQQEIGCTLSTVIANMQGSYQGFVGGDFRQGGWQNWLAIAGNNQNNAYGAYFATTDKLNASIVTATGEEIKLLDWGRGFKSWRKCLEREQTYNHETEAVTDGKCIREGPIQTPGSVIVDQTSGALKTQMDRFQVADEIDEILGALTNQLLSRAMGGIGGLIGSSQADNNGVRYIDTLITDLDAAQRAADAPVAPPAGIDCKLEALYVQGTGDKLMVRYDYTLKKAADTLTEARDETKASLTTLSKPSSQAWSDYFVQISRGCANVVDRFLVNRAESVEDIITVDANEVGGATPPQIRAETTNLAMGKKVGQSSPYPSAPSYPPEQATDGSSQTYSHTGYSESEQWWEVDLGSFRNQPSDENTVYEIQKIEKITVTQRADEPHQSQSLSAYFSDTPFAGMLRAEIIRKATPCERQLVTAPIRCYIIPDTAQVGEPADVVNKPLPAGEKGRYLRILKGTGYPIAIAEIEVHGTATYTTRTSGSVTPSTAPLSVTIAPAPKPREGSTSLCGESHLFTTSLCQSSGSSATISNIVKLTANRDTIPTEKVAISVQLLFSATSVKDVFSNIFAAPSATKSFFATITRGNNRIPVLETPSFVVESAVLGVRKMNPYLAQGGLGWDPITTSAIAFDRVFVLNAGPDGLDLRNPGTASAFLNKADGPVFIAAGLSLEKDRPLFISFTGTLAGLPSNHIVRINVFRDQNGVLTPITSSLDLQINR